MISIQPATPKPAEDQREIIIPDEIASIFDEANIPGGPHSAVFGNGCVSMIVTATKEVVKTVPWPDANEFARRVLEASLRLTVEDGQ